MALQKIIGTETEFGVIVTGTDMSPVVASGLLIGQYAASELRRVRWDYAEEAPLRDARGWEIPGNREAGEEEGQLVNCVLTNGARYYVDHAHPEYSSPETTNPTDALIWDVAGVRILAEATRRVSEILPSGARIVVHKNNSDGKGNSYGAHENYLLSREIGFARLAACVMPFMVSRQVFCGAGKVGCEESDSQFEGYQLSQRADFIEAEIGLETTLKRPLVNTRDEPHADPDLYRRLHVIGGDANMSELATWLRVGTTALLLCAIEDHVIEPGFMELEAPVSSVKTISKDVSLKATVRCADGSTVTGLQIQWEYLEALKRYAKTHDLPAGTEWASEVLDVWEGVLTELESDPMQLADRLDWPAKLALLDSYRERDGLRWNSPKLRMIDLQYHDVIPEKSLYQRLVDSGRMQRMVSEEDVLHAVSKPPSDTRAWFRGSVLARFAPSLAAACWDALIFDVDQRTLKRVPLMDPLKGTEELTSALLADAEDAADLIHRLGG